MKNENPARKKGGVRLSKNVIPFEYNIKLHPDLENFTFEGIETIILSVLKPTKSITLHSKEIEISTAEVLVEGIKTFAKISISKRCQRKHRKSRERKSP